MSITWKYVKPLLKQDAVSQCLASHGVQLPQQVVVSLGEHNGGRPSLKMFATSDGRDCVLSYLYSYNDGDANSISSINVRDLIECGCYPVAQEASGDIICLLLSDKRLVLWRHETGAIVAIDISSNIDLFNSLSPDL